VTGALTLLISSLLMLVLAVDPVQPTILTLGTFKASAMLHSRLNRTTPLSMPLPPPAAATAAAAAALAVAALAVALAVAVAAALALAALAVAVAVGLEVVLIAMKEETMSVVTIKQPQISRARIIKTRTTTKNKEQSYHT